MQLALIPPTSMLWQTESQSMHLLLPEVMSHPTMDAFVARVHGYKILDNGAAEGATVSINRLHMLCALGMFNEVVAPDALGDAAFTLSSAQSMQHFKGLLPDMNIMAVVQGHSLAEVMKCYTALYYMDWIDVIGLPRDLNVRFGRESRAQLASSLNNDPGFNKKPLHCLGSYYLWPEEIKYLREIPIVRSMDTSLPYVFGYHMLTFDDAVPPNISRPPNYFEWEPDDAQREVINQNVERYTKWAEAPSSTV